MLTPLTLCLTNWHYSHIRIKSINVLHSLQKILFKNKRWVIIPPPPFKKRKKIPYKFIPLPSTRNYFHKPRFGWLTWKPSTKFIFYRRKKNEYIRRDYDNQKSLWKVISSKMGKKPFQACSFDLQLGSSGYTFMWTNDKKHQSNGKIPLKQCMLMNKPHYNIFEITSIRHRSTICWFYKLFVPINFDKNNILQNSLAYDLRLIVFRKSSSILYWYKFFCQKR